MTHTDQTVTVEHKGMRYEVEFFRAEGSSGYRVYRLKSNGTRGMRLGAHLNRATEIMLLAFRAEAPAAPRQ